MSDRFILNREVLIEKKPMTILIKPEIDYCENCWYFSGEIFVVNINKPNVYFVVKGRFSGFRILKEHCEKIK